MKNIKKKFSLIIIFVLIFSLSACAPIKENKESDTSVLTSSGSKSKSSSRKSKSSNSKSKSSSKKSKSSSSKSKSSSSKSKSSDSKSKSSSSETESSSSETDSSSSEAESSSGETEYSSDEDESSSGEAESSSDEDESSSGEAESSSDEDESSSSEAESSNDEAESSSSETESYEKIENFEPHTFVYSSGLSAYGFYDMGNCRKLVGDVYTLVIFLDDDVSSWDEKSRKTFFNKKFFPSINYINDQAELRDVELNLDCGQYTTSSDLTSPPRYDGTIEPDISNVINNLDVFSQVAKTLGFSDRRILHAYLQNYTGCEQISYVIVLNKPGRAYAVTDTFDDGIDAVEYVVAFSKSYSGLDDIGSSIIHEMLHLFGATDFYDPNGDYPKRKELCKKLYPDDIMMRSAVDPYDLSIGRLTECLIGWSDYFPPECDCPEWWETDKVVTHRPPAGSD